MTVKCGGGTSAAKPGFDQVVIGAALITAGLADISPWLLPVAALVDAFVYDVQAECPGDPPPMPTSAQLDILNVLPGGVLNPNFPAWATAVKNLLLNWAWVQYCECTSGSLVPNNYPPPSSTSITPAPTGVTPCLSGHWTGAVTQKNTTGHVGDWQSLNSMFGNLPTFNVTMFSETFPVISIPTGATGYSWSGVGTLGTGSVAGQMIDDVGLDTWDAAGNHVEGVDLRAWSALNGNTFVGQKNLVSPAQYFRLSATSDNFPGTPVPSNLDFSFNWICGTSSPIATPCCPPDPAVLTTLQQLYQLVLSIYQGLPKALTSYAESTVHTVSGNGSFLIGAQTIGVKVALTSIGSTVGFVPGDPLAYINAGWITPIAAEAPLQGSPIRYSPQVIPLPDIAEQVGYTLSPGTNATITELVPGP